MSEIKTNKMATKKMAPLIAGMALPAMLSMFIMAMYNVVDSIFVAKIGDNALTAVSLAYPIQMLVIAVGVGTGVGLNSLISRKLGQGDKEAASDAAAHGLVLAAISGLAFAILGILVTRIFFNAFTDDPVIFDMGCQYTYIVTILSVFSIISISAEKILQGTGNMVFPMVQNLCGAIVNIILDPIMIFGLFGFPKWGVAGAAIATIIGQFVSMSIGIAVIFGKKHAMHVTLKGFKLKKSVVKDIYQVGFPSIVMQSVVSVMVTLLNAILVGYSDVAVAVLGVYFKLQSFVFMPVFGIMQGAMPVLGFNFGARDLKRLKSAYKVTAVFSVAIMAAGMVLFQLMPDKLLLMFNDSQEMQSVGIYALKIVSLSFIGAALGITNSTLFQAIGRGVASLTVSVIRQLIVIVPAAYILGKLFGLNAIWFAFPLAELVAFLTSFALLVVIYKKQLHFLGSENESQENRGLCND